MSLFLCVFVCSQCLSQYWYKLFEVGSKLFVSHVGCLIKNPWISKFLYQKSTVFFYAPCPLNFQFFVALNNVRSTIKMNFLLLFFFFFFCDIMINFVLPKLCNAKYLVDIDRFLETSNKIMNELKSKKPTKK